MRLALLGCAANLHSAINKLGCDLWECSPLAQGLAAGLARCSSGAVQVYEKKVAHLANYNKKDEQPGTASHPSMNWSIPAG